MNAQQYAVLEVKLDQIIQDLSEVKRSLYGNGDKPGLRLDVDRLKRSNKTHTAVLWTIFTAGVGAVIMAVVQVTLLQ